VERRALSNYDGTPLTKEAIVARKGKKWVLKTKDGSRVLGTHESAQDAYKQEYAIQKSQEREAAKMAATNVAEAYAFYKLAAIEAILQLNPTLDPDALAMLAVAQNA
jgi:hypothetical protein